MREGKMRIGALLTAIMLCLALVFYFGVGSASAKGKIKELVLATATTGGTYYPVGVALSTLWSIKLRKAKPIPVKVNAITSAGSGENIDMLRKKEVDMAILQGLFGKMAWNGQGIYKGKPLKSLRTITMLWPNVEHFVIMSDKVKTGTILDIKGTKLSIGRAGSGTERSGLTIMAGVGLSIKDVKPVYLGYFETSKAFKDKRIEAANLCGGPPVAAVTDIFSAPGVKATILEFTDEQLAAINEKTMYPGFRYILPANTYPGQTKPVRTIAQPNFLGILADVDKDTAYLLTKTIFENLPYLNNIHKATKHIKLESAISGLPAPLHPGAYKYYVEQGLRIPDKIVPPEEK